MAINGASKLNVAACRANELSVSGADGIADGVEGGMSGGVFIMRADV